MSDELLSRGTCRTGRRHDAAWTLPSVHRVHPGARLFRLGLGASLALAVAACAPSHAGIAPGVPPVVATGDSATDRPPAERSRVAGQIDAYLDSLSRTGKFAGTVLVAERGHTMLERSYGEASVELHVLLTNGLRYRLHSITKQFTATAVLALSARGRLDLDAPVRRYLPELPAAWGAATVAQLLTHTSGIPDAESTWADSFMQHDVHTQLENLALVAPRLAMDSLASPPGTAWRYNNFGYDLLACVIERVAGQPFEAFVRTAVFEPAGMVGAGFDQRSETNPNHGRYVAPAVVEGLAPGYNGDAAHLMGAAPQMYASAGAGGMYATAEDLLRYDAALTAGSILPPAVAQQAVARAHVLRPTGAYGYGWIITRSLAGDYFLHHSGGNNGYGTEYARFPREGATVIVLSNRGYSEPEEVRHVITRLLFGGRYP
ncbi:MAG: penicillin-binding protein beta-lactamase class [Gemmatimonadetes bacterium]|nr:penicillin-binding protein beta-lactamase class [Gemmatimonadota bacterium]